MTAYLLVVLLLWKDPSRGPLEARYEVRVVGLHSTQERCEQRRAAIMDARSGAAWVLWSECRAAD